MKLIAKWMVITMLSGVVTNNVESGTCVSVQVNARVQPVNPRRTPPERFTFTKKEVEVYQKLAAVSARSRSLPNIHIHIPSAATVQPQVPAHTGMLLVARNVTKAAGAHAHASQAYVQSGAPTGPTTSMAAAVKLMSPIASPSAQPMADPTPNAGHPERDPYANLWQTSADLGGAGLQLFIGQLPGDNEQKERG